MIVYNKWLDSTAYYVFSALGNICPGTMRLQIQTLALVLVHINFSFCFICFLGVYIFRNFYIYI